MKIIIENNCEEEETKVMASIKRFCKENFRDCKIKVNELEDEIKWEKPE